MSGKYEQAITIRDAIQKIGENKFLLPSIQRKFIWKSEQICTLFDLIMKEYPINSFMVWTVKNNSIKKDNKFYGFIQNYQQRFKEENPEHRFTAGTPEFMAIIDGQQRLTSLYIGLCGTYAYKRPRTWWPNVYDENILPPRKLYLDIKNPLSSDNNDTRMSFNFRFLTDEQYKESLNLQNKEHWFCVHKVLENPEISDSDTIYHDIILPYLNKYSLSENEFSRKTLSKLYSVIRFKDTIHYFNETEQNIDYVLDVFIRTNAGGTQLTFSDLLMSIAVANWNGDFRKEVDDLTKQILQDPQMGFYIERDWVLKTCLMLIDTDVGFKVKNFKSEQVEKIQNEWDDIKNCIKSTFKFLREMGINQQSLTSKNSVIPICYYLYKKNDKKQKLYIVLDNSTKYSEQRKKITKWLNIVLLKGIFGGQADTILSSMRDILKDNIDKSLFPLKSIIERYTATSKDLRFDDEYIEKLLDIQYGSNQCASLLHIIFPELGTINAVDYDIDHLHPKSAFDKKQLKKYDFLLENEDLMSFFENKQHWNSIPNLYLLKSKPNKSKNDTPLKQWVEENNIKYSDLFIDENMGLDIEDFKYFYES